MGGRMARKAEVASVGTLPEGATLFNFDVSADAARKHVFEDLVAESGAAVQNRRNRGVSGGESESVLVFELNLTPSQLQSLLGRLDGRPDAFSAIANTQRISANVKDKARQLARERFGAAAGSAWGAGSVPPAKAPAVKQSVVFTLRVVDRVSPAGSASPATRKP
jgi:hypothetical protein